MKYLLMVTTMLLSVVLSSCTASYDDVPVVIYNGEDPYITGFQSKIVKNSEGKFTVRMYDSQNSQLLQNELINDLLEQNPKVLVINPVDRLGAYTIIEKAKAANVPVVFFNREPLEEDLSVWNYAFYVGTFAEGSAIIQSEMVVELFGNANNLSDLDKNNDGKIQIVLLKGEQGHQDAEKRTTVIIQELERYGYDIELLSLEVCDWNREIANEFMLDFIPDHGDSIELVISNNDAMALGAIDAMKELELFKDLNEDGFYDMDNDDWIPVIGIDGLTEAIPYLEEGTMYGTVLNDADLQAQAIIELVDAIINGEDPNSINFEIIDNNYIWVEYTRFVLDED